MTTVSEAPTPAAAPVPPEPHRGRTALAPDTGRTRLRWQQATVPPPRELVPFAWLHARALGLDARLCREALQTIMAREDEPGIWPRTWRRVAHQHWDRGRADLACGYLTMARFPYPGDPERAEAGTEAVEAFDSWRRGRNIDRVELEVEGGSTALWVSGRRPGRPLVLVSGGIVSTKEQWAGFLAKADLLGAAVAVSELPSVGESTPRYGTHSRDWFPSLLDGLGSAMCGNGVHVVGLSFAGHLALAAGGDPRIRSIHTVGAPVARIFDDQQLRAALPTATTQTLRHLHGCHDLDHLAPLSLTVDEVSQVSCPVSYVASRRDEVIPRREWELLVENLPELRWIEFDDVHGSPTHLRHTARWIAARVLNALGRPSARALSAAVDLGIGCDRRPGRAPARQGRS